jgi:hypothetical protein
MRLNTIGKIFIGTAAATAAASALGGGEKKSSGGLGCLGCAAIILLMGFGGFWAIVLAILSLFS